MPATKHLYSFSYDHSEGELCKLESRSVFNKEDKNKLLFSDVYVEPSISAFIKSRLDILCASEDYSTLISEIKKKRICVEGFKVEYLAFDGINLEYAERLEKLKDIGYSIEGNPDYYKPTIIYALCYFEGIWCFGVLNKNSFAWHKHKQKPCSFSNSISIHIAKALVNIATKANKELRLLDACCGVGTIMLEACFAGNNIEGCDINWKLASDARINLSHFNYTAKVVQADIKDLSSRYDAVIVDLPYNLLSYASEKDILHIISATAELSDRLVIVSTSDITEAITNTGFSISDACNIRKRGKASFTRNIWLCDL